MRSHLSVNEYLQQQKLGDIIEKAVNKCYQAQTSNPVEFFQHYFTQLAVEIDSENGNGQASLIDRVVGREVLDSRGIPTIEVDIYTRDGKLAGSAAAPGSMNVGSNEARDSDSQWYLGKGVQKAVHNVASMVSHALKNCSLFMPPATGTQIPYYQPQKSLDEKLKSVDESKLKEVCGVNTITATSFAVAEAASNISRVPLFLYFAKQFNNKTKYTIPYPMATIISGGKPIGGKLKVQDIMVVLRGAQSVKEAIHKISNIYHHVGKILTASKGGPAAKNVGNEGGYAPFHIENPDDALNVLEQGIRAAGLEVGGIDGVGIAIGCAASQFYNADKKKYEIVDSGKGMTSDELIVYYEKLITGHPGIIMMEDPLHDTDHAAWMKLTEKIGSRVTIVGDELYASDPALIQQGIASKWANAVLLRINQIGTISEAVDTAQTAIAAEHNVVMSLSAGETTSALVVDLAVALGCSYVKIGAPARGERISKYNRLLQIEEYLSEHAMLDQLVVPQQTASPQTSSRSSTPKRVPSASGKRA